MKRPIYEFECGPLDYWEKWHDIFEFSEVICQYIQKNPKNGVNYNRCLLEMKELHARVLCRNDEPFSGVHYKSIRCDSFYFWFQEEFFVYPWGKEIIGLIFVLAYKEDSNGTCKAFSLHHFCDQLYLIENIVKNSEDVTSMFQSNKKNHSFLLKTGAIPSDFGDEWRLINPYYEK